MSNDTFIVEAQKRTDQGKGASRRLRRTGRFPAIVYGNSIEPEMISIDHDRFEKQIANEAFFAHILTIDVDGQKTQAVIKDLHRHPSRPYVLHADFMRINAKETLRVSIPLHFEGEEEAPGIKMDDGIATHALAQVEVECLPGNLPEYITIDMSAMNIGDTVHLSDLKLPKGVELVDLMHGEDADALVATVEATRASSEAEEEEEGAPEAPEAPDVAGEEESGDEDNG